MFSAENVYIYIYIVSSEVLKKEKRKKKPLKFLNKTKSVMDGRR